MKNTCVVRVDAEYVVNFYPMLGSSTAYVPSWPAVLRKKFRGAGVYSIHRVRRATAGSACVAIIGEGNSEWSHEVPARFLKPGGYGLCARFLNELGVSPPPEGKRKTIHLVVTKRRK
ncbi:hypothetical protein LCGC14_1348530 [marine sediment metagenome]|uniref:Uncharacterized protein n=1 Tax=marine sediment metagenome TaxID=412755 RepID=A0A0F9KXL5_9ZZZZ